MPSFTTYLYSHLQIMESTEEATSTVSSTENKIMTSTASTMEPVIINYDSLVISLNLSYDKG